MGLLVRDPIIIENLVLKYFCLFCYRKGGRVFVLFLGEDSHHQVQSFPCFDELNSARSGYY